MCVEFPDGRKLILPCVVLEYIDSRAITFEKFLENQTNIDNTIFNTFIERVGTVLSEIEKAGLVHGDLHERNILVMPGQSPNVVKDFWVIDYIGIPSINSSELESLTDMENFYNHLMRAAIITCNNYNIYSLRLALGEKAYRILEGLRNKKYKSFSELLEDFNKKIEVPADYFEAPRSQTPLSYSE